MSKRRLAAGLLLALLVTTSGCSVLTQDTYTFASEPVSVSSAAQQDTDYQETRVESFNATRTFTVFGMKKTVKVTNHLGEYARTSDVPLFGDKKVARFTALSTPQVKIAGRTLNPYGDYSNRELALQMQKQYESIENVKKVGDRKETFLGEKTKVSKFRAKARMEGGQKTEVFIHIAKRKHEGDFVIAIAVYPTKVDGEQQKVNRLLKGVKHG